MSKKNKTKSELRNKELLEADRIKAIEILDISQNPCNSEVFDIQIKALPSDKEFFKSLRDEYEDLDFYLGINK